MGACTASLHALALAFHPVTVGFPMLAVLLHMFSGPLIPMLLKLLAMGLQALALPLLPLATILPVLPVVLEPLAWWNGSYSYARVVPEVPAIGVTLAPVLAEVFDIPPFLPSVLT